MRNYYSDSRAKRPVILAFNKLYGNNSGDGSYYKILLKSLNIFSDPILVDLKFPAKSTALHPSLNKQRVIARHTNIFKFYLRLFIAFISSISYSGSAITLSYLFRAFKFFCYHPFLINGPPAIIVVQHWYLVPFAKFLQRLYNCPDAFVYCNLHVNDHSALQQVLNKNNSVLSLSHILSLRLKLFLMESDLYSQLSHSDRIAVFSSDDKCEIPSKYHSKMFLTPLTISDHIYDCNEKLALPNDSESETIFNRPLTLCFLGDLFWEPNLLSLRVLSQVVQLSSALFGQDVYVKVAGRYPSYLIKRFPLLKLLGYVDDLDRFISSSDYFVNPVDVGGGLRTKNFHIYENYSIPIFLNSRYRGELPDNIRVKYFGDALHLVTILFGINETSISTPSFLLDQPL